MLNFIGRHSLELTARSVAAALRTLRSTFVKLSRHESDALRSVLEDASGRADVAAQAGDMSTLLGDQLRMHEYTRERMRKHWRGAADIVRQAFQEWRQVARYHDEQIGVEETDKSG